MPRIPTVLSNLSAAVLLMASSLAMAQQAQPAPPRDREPERELQQAPRVSLSDAVRRVERNTRGEVLSAERIQFDGRDMHRVKVVDDQGRVRVFMQDPVRRDRPSPRPQRDDE
ncbi:hypothetical protein [Thermomonas sp. LB-4]|uniref:PepSY domain-containing protein n=1 Tax=Thermomonas sp. LB-4 TaxID=3102790 RepID=UPI002EDAE7C6